MTAATCPHCRDQVTVPTGADPESTVRCPLCQEEFQLSVVLESLPPQLIVVGGEQASAVGGLGDERPAFLAAGTGTAEADGGEFRLAEEEHEETESHGGFQLDMSGEEPAASSRGGTAGPVAKPSVAARAKKSKPKKSPAMEIVKVFLGGVVGLTIGYVLLWWILAAMGRRPQDPVGVAPTVSRFAPWIVPAQLRPADPNANDTSGGFNDEAADASAQFSGRSGPRVVPAPSRRKPVVPPPPQNGPGEPAGSPSAASPFENLADTGNDPLAGGGPSELGIDVPDIELPGFGDADGEPTATSPTEPVAGGGSPRSPAENGAPPPTSPGNTTGSVVDAPEITASQFQERLDNAQAKEATWQGTRENDKSREAVNFYIAASALGEALTFADQRDPEIQRSIAQAQQWADKLAAEPAKTDRLGTLGAKWLTSPSRTQDGVLLTGTVQAVRQRDAFHEIRLGLPGTSGPEEVSVLLASPPASGLQPGVRLLVLGAIRDDPASQLTGYSGTEERVVLGGYLAGLATPAAEPPAEPEAQSDAPDAPASDVSGSNKAPGTREEPAASDDQATRENQPAGGNTGPENPPGSEAPEPQEPGNSESSATESPEAEG